MPNATDTTALQLALLREIRDQLRRQHETQLRIEELKRHRGPQSGAGDMYQPTLDGGLETPYAMADVSIVQSADIVGKGVDFASVGQSSDIHHFTGGEVIVTVAEVKPAALFSYAADVQVVAMVSNQVNILATGVVNNGTGPLIVPIPIAEAYTFITIKARQLVNGLPSSNFPGNTPAMLGAKLTLAASGRFYR